MQSKKKMFYSSIFRCLNHAKCNAMQIQECNQILKWNKPILIRSNKKKAINVDSTCYKNIIYFTHAIVKCHVNRFKEFLQFD